MQSACLASTHPAADVAPINMTAHQQSNVDNSMFPGLSGACHGALPTNSHLKAPPLPRHTIESFVQLYNGTRDAPNSTLTSGMGGPLSSGPTSVRRSALLTNSASRYACSASPSPDSPSSGVTHAQPGRDAAAWCGTPSPAQVMYTVLTHLCSGTRHRRGGRCERQARAATLVSRVSVGLPTVSRRVPQLQKPWGAAIYELLYICIIRLHQAASCTAPNRTGEKDAEAAG